MPANINRATLDKVPREARRRSATLIHLQIPDAGDRQSAELPTRIKSEGARVRGQPARGSPSRRGGQALWRRRLFAALEAKGKRNSEPQFRLLAVFRRLGTSFPEPDTPRPRGQRSVARARPPTSRQAAEAHGIPVRRCPRSHQEFQHLPRDAERARSRCSRARAEELRGHSAQVARLTRKMAERIGVGAG